MTVGYRITKSLLRHAILDPSHLKDILSLGIYDL